MFYGVSVNCKVSNDEKTYDKLVEDKMVGKSTELAAGLLRDSGLVIVDDVVFAVGEFVESMKTYAVRNSGIRKRGSQCVILELETFYISKAAGKS